MKSKLEFVATCAYELESLLRDELISLGADVVKVDPGAVSFQGDLEVAYSACLWTRLANSILLPLVDCSITSDDDLYEQVLAITWSEHLFDDSTFSIQVAGQSDVIKNSHYAMLRTKDALVDWSAKNCSQRWNIDTDNADVTLHLFLRKDMVTLSLDLSGSSLHKRGYRAVTTEAPLKENISAAVVKYSTWVKDAANAELENKELPVLIDPMCGSGTLLIEAGLAYADIAPGLHRKYYGFKGWAGHDASLWETLVQQAQQRKADGLAKKWPQIVGFDADKEAVNASRINIKNAGLEKYIHVERATLAQLPDQKVLRFQKCTGHVVTNPPYGERLGDLPTARYLHQCIGRIAREALSGWQLTIVSGQSELLDAVGLTWDNHAKLYNGALSCQVRHFPIPDQEPGSEKPSFSVNLSTEINGDEEFSESAIAFVNRVKKNWKQRAKWARKQGIQCFRVYDADIPEFNLAVDVYNDVLHVQEYAPPKSIDEEKARERIQLALASLRKLFGLHRDKVFIKVRSKQKGSSQYEQREQKKKFSSVQEYGAHLLVNFTDYLDTGLFLDHRPLRLMIQEQSAGKRVLNCFSYTGSISVHAAKGGAKSVISVDTSKTYLDWARSNFALNGFDEEQHQFIQSDCGAWMKKTSEQFDLIILDPPTFSNSKKRLEVFDIQRDHVELILTAIRRLEPGGVLYFSNNFRRFKMDEEALAHLELKDITRNTIDLDYARNQKIHNCWTIQYKTKSTEA